MISQHVYEAVLIGEPDQSLGVQRGRITLDAGRAPHVESNLDIAIPSFGAAVLGLDPRLNARVRIVVDATFPTAVQHREFDLGVRNREVRHADAILSVTLASDEALLNDYAPLVDDETPFSLASSLRDVIDYVLGVAIPGAALEPGTTDADVTPYWRLENLVLDPSVTSLAHYANGGNAHNLALAGAFPWHGTSYLSWQSIAAGNSFVDIATQNSIRRGSTYTLSAYFTGTGRQNFVRMNVLDANGAVLQRFDSVTVTLGSGWNRISVTGTVTHPAAASLDVFAAGVASAANQYFDVDGIMLTEGHRLVPFFLGSTTDTDTYAYEFTGDTNASASVREPVIERAPESLTWRAGVPAYEFLNPLVQAAGLRLVCNENREWSLRDEEYRSPGSMSIRHAVNLIDATDSIARDSGIWFDARVTRYLWTDDTGLEQERTDAYALTVPYTQLTTLEIEAPYPGPGRSEYAVRRAQGRGREVTASCVADWRAQTDMPMTVVLDGTPILTGISQTVEYDLGTDRVTVTMRAVDTPPLAWVLGPDDLTWDDVTPTLAWASMTDWSDA